MEHIDIDIERIRKCVDNLVTKAINEIPKMPAETSNVEHYSVETGFYINNVQYHLSLSCSPPLKSDHFKSILICCVVELPELGISLESPVMNKTIVDTLSFLDKDDVKYDMVITFDSLIKDIIFNYGHTIYVK